MVFDSFLNSMTNFLKDSSETIINTDIYNMDSTL